LVVNDLLSNVPYSLRLKPLLVESGAPPMTHTTPITELSSHWQTWLQTNLARGCTPQSLVDSMVNMPL
jgi:hypothetical protein